MIVSNTITKIGRRTPSELEGLNIANLETSDNSVRVGGIADITYVDKSTNNTMNRLKNKTVGGLSGLLISIVENSLKNYTINLPFKFIYPKKSYNTILRLYKQYIIKIKG